MATVQEHYFNVLMHRVINDRYPSHQMLDRLEAALVTSEQVTQYTDMLIEKVDETWYPSGQMLDRIQRMFERTAAA
jgi:23S rRNA maturation-related 3'-5' exoribonuclease YhaM